MCTLSAIVMPVVQTDAQQPHVSECGVPTVTASWTSRGGNFVTPWLWSEASSANQHKA